MNNTFSEALASSQLIEFVRKYFNENGTETKAVIGISGDRKSVV